MAYEVLTHAVCITYLVKSQNEIWFGVVSPAQSNILLKSAYCWWKRPSKCLLNTESSIYLMPGHDHLQDLVHVLMRGGWIIETSHITWEVICNLSLREAVGDTRASRR